MVDLAQTIEEWRDVSSIKVDDQVMVYVLIRVCHLLSKYLTFKGIFHFILNLVISKVYFILM